MSDWELVDSPQKGRAASGKNFDWEIVPNAPASEQAPQEGFATAALKAPYRIGEDLYKGAAHFIKGIPDYWNQAQTEVPGAFNALTEHPGHAAGQLGAGVTEMGHNLLNMPKGLADYLSHRLNLLPEKYAQKVPYQEDISGDINQVFGEPKYAGEKLIRGAGRNALNLAGAGGIAKTLNPLNLTAKNIAKDVLNTEKKQVLEHGKRYNKIWNEAEKTGYNQVPVNQKLLSDNLSIIEKYKTPREYQSLEDFILDPTLQNAQKAQSDMGIIHRTLDKKSRKGSLTSEEQAIYKAAYNAEKHIENNMFAKTIPHYEEKIPIERYDVGNMFGVSHNSSNTVLPTNNLGMIKEGNKARVINSKVGLDQRGKGIGKALYKAAIEDSLKKGLQFESDSIVSNNALNVYKALEKEGYKFKFNPKVKETLMDHEGNTYKGLESLDELSPVVELISTPKNKIFNKELQKQYKILTNSYRQNVVPYKYNQAIQKYKAQESLPNELVNSLSKGEFAAKKGNKHRAIGIRNNLGPISIGSAIGVGLPWLYKQMFGDNHPEQ